MMPYIKRDTCYFCKRNSKKKFFVKILNKERVVCSECKYIYDTMRKQHLSKRSEILTKIYETLKYSKRHCTICKYFNINNRSKCRKGYWTGIGDHHRQVYPHSYANSNCPQFTKEET